MQSFLLRFFFVCSALSCARAWIHHPSPSLSLPTTRQPTTRILLRMGLLDSLSNFLQDREGDFVKLQDTDDTEYGPGPAVLLYNVPSNLLDEELRDMLSDGAPQATQKRITMARISTGISSNNAKLLDLPLQDALERVVAQSSSTTEALSTDAGILSTCPVLLFSGFSNKEMMAAYNIIAGEIYQETAGQSRAACAKAVPNAMQKSLRQLLEEISGDHQEVLKQEG